MRAIALMTRPLRLENFRHSSIEEGTIFVSAPRATRSSIVTSASDFQPSPRTLLTCLASLRFQRSPLTLLSLFAPDSGSRASNHPGHSEGARAIEESLFPVEQEMNAPKHRSTECSMASSDDSSMLAKPIGLGKFAPIAAFALLVSHLLKPPFGGLLSTHSRSLSQSVNTSTVI